MNKYLYFNIITHRVREWSDLSSLEKDAFINCKGDCILPEKCYISESSLMAEFGQVINVSFGYVNSIGNWKEYSVFSIDEKSLLQKVSSILDAFASEGYAFAGYNVTYFDIPFLTKRFIINGIRIPDSLKRYDKKYWELNDFNLKQLWKFNGGYDTSLEVICASLGIDIKNFLDIYKVFDKPISEVNLEEVAKLSSLRNRLVCAVRDKIINLIE